MLSVNKSVLLDFVLGRILNRMTCPIVLAVLAGVFGTARVCFCLIWLTPTTQKTESSGGNHFQLIRFIDDTILLVHPLVDHVRISCTQQDYQP